MGGVGAAEEVTLGVELEGRGSSRSYSSPLPSKSRRKLHYIIGESSRGGARSGVRGGATGIRGGARCGVRGGATGIRGGARCGVRGGATGIRGGARSGVRGGATGIRGGARCGVIRSGGGGLQGGC